MGCVSARCSRFQLALLLRCCFAELLASVRQLLESLRYFGERCIALPLCFSPANRQSHMLATVAQLREGRARDGRLRYFHQGDLRFSKLKQVSSHSAYSTRRLLFR